MIENEDLKDFVEHISLKMWNILWQCKSGHPYYWAIHNMYGWVENLLDYGGIDAFLRDVFGLEEDELIVFLEETLAGMELLLNAGRGGSPLSCKKAILRYLRRSDRPRHLTEIGGMLLHEEGTYIDNARLSAALSNWREQEGLYNKSWFGLSEPMQRGYWWTKAEKQQTELQFDKCDSSAVP